MSVGLYSTAGNGTSMDRIASFHAGGMSAREAVIASANALTSNHVAEITPTCAMSCEQSSQKKTSAV